MAFTEEEYNYFVNNYVEEKFNPEDKHVIEFMRYLNNYTRINFDEVDKKVVAIQKEYFYRLKKFLKIYFVTFKFLTNNYESKLVKDNLQKSNVLYVYDVQENEGLIVDKFKFIYTVKLNESINCYILSKVKLNLDAINIIQQKYLF